MSVYFATVSNRDSSTDLPKESIDIMNLIEKLIAMSSFVLLQSILYLSLQFLITILDLIHLLLMPFRLLLQLPILLLLRCLYIGGQLLNRSLQFLTLLLQLCNLVVLHRPINTILDFRSSESMTLRIA
jgi:hypothetical protein